MSLMIGFQMYVHSIYACSNRTTQEQQQLKALLARSNAPSHSKKLVILFV